MAQLPRVSYSSVVLASNRCVVRLMPGELVILFSK